MHGVIPEQSVVRYLYGDEYSLKAWEPLWEIDQLYIGSYVCVLQQKLSSRMGGNKYTSYGLV